MSSGGGGLPSQALVRPSSPNVGRTNIDAETFQNIMSEPSNGASRFLNGPLQMADMMPPPSTGGMGAGMGGGMGGGAMGGMM